MKTKIKRYFDKTIELMNAIEISIEKRQVGLFQGIEEACRIVQSIADNKKKIMFIGNGGSAAIASHMAIDFWKNGKIKALAFNDGAQLTCLSNDCGYEQVFAKPISMFADEGDILFAISSSGKSENILNGVKTAQAKGCEVITLSGFNESNPLRKMGNYNFYVSSDEYGPVEVVHQFICHYILDIYLKEKERLDA